MRSIHTILLMLLVWSTAVEAAAGQTRTNVAVSNQSEIRNYGREFDRKTVVRQRVSPKRFIYAAECGVRQQRAVARASAYASDNNLYAGLWRAGTGAHAAWFTTNWQQFTSKWDEFARGGMRMHDYESFTVGPSRVYAGIFRAGTGGHAAWVVSDWKNFTNKWDEFGKQGLRMHDFESYADGGKQTYAGIFRAGSDGHAAWLTNNWNEFTAKWAEFEKGGLRMHDYESYMDGGRRVYAGIFRAGTDARAAWLVKDWNSFTGKWDEFNKGGLRITDFETYPDGGQVLAGIFRGGNDAHYAWIGVDWENFTAKWNELNAQSLRLSDIEIYPGSCSSDCLNKAVMPSSTCPPSVPANQCVYNYGVTMTATHCPGLPGTCGTPAAGSMVVYNQPIDLVPGDRFLRLSAVDAKDAIFTLPFKDTDLSHNGWLYSLGSWHHAIDYGKPGGATFNIVAAAPGRVIHVGWDLWSGGTIVVSHNAGGVTDAYRTIYMHVRNGAKSDCQTAWTATVPWLESDPNNTDLANQYKAYLNATGCKKNGTGTPDSSRWGTDADAISSNLLGKQVQAGEFLAKAGSTGPGGCGCIPSGTGPNNHLHIFFARRDTTNNNWYLFDPYGIYAPSNCYPSGMTDAPGNTPCARYPVAWKGGKPQYPS